jgi:hypothetical protein
MKQGLDKSLIYSRNEEILDCSKNRLHYDYYQELRTKTINDYIHTQKSGVSINTGVLGFCGKQYLILFYHHDEINFLVSCSYPRWVKKLKETKLNDSPKNAYKVIENSLMEKGQYKTFFHHRQELKMTQENILMTLTEYNDKKINDELFIELNCPLFLIYISHNNWGKTYLIKNPPLHCLDFQCILRPELCFQEIAHYLGNVLTKRDNPAQITDNKILCAAKGFDVKTSFRKSPSKQ